MFTSSCLVSHFRKTYRWSFSENLKCIIYQWFLKSFFILFTNDTNISLFIRTFLLFTSLIQYGGIGSYVNIDLKSVNESSLKNLIVFLYFFKSIFNTHISSILLYNVLYRMYCHHFIQQSAAMEKS